MGQQNKMGREAPETRKRLACDSPRRRRGDVCVCSLGGPEAHRQGLSSCVPVTEDRDRGTPRPRAQAGHEEATISQDLT